MMPLRVVVVVALAGVAAPRALAQGEITQPTSRGGTRVGVVRVPDPADPRQEAYRAEQRRRVALERELYTIRAQHFGAMRNETIRRAGIEKLRAFDEPVIFPSLLKIFAREKADVRTAILDHLAALGTDQADATLAWAAVFDRDREHRGAAAERLAARCRETGGASERVRSVIAEGMRRTDRDALAAAAHLADVLNVVQAIPMLITAQLGGGGAGAGGGSGGESSLAQIVVGTQTAYVSDLQPVVGDSAVGFDPQLAVVTEGVVLRVVSATVVTYQYDVHRSLVALSGRAWGRSTEHLGFDQRAWAKWYEDEFLPTRAGKK